ncbi:MAG TPA: fluoride efflux transporter CrcB [Dermatophilaceae bacterium]|nr:fluoride efflux transporter CrcB [Dermatophilaceae bacterium]
MTLLMIALGAAVGAPARYLTDRAVQSRHESVMPWGTLSVNVIGSLILGALTGAGAAVSPGVVALIGTGFCGALTTYSTFSFETWRLVEEECYAAAVANVMVSVAAALAAVAIGYAASSALTG